MESGRLQFYLKVAVLLALAVFTAIRAVDAHFARALGAFAVLWQGRRLGRESDTGKSEHDARDHGFHGSLYFSGLKKRMTNQALRPVPSCFLKPPGAAVVPEAHSMSAIPDPLPE